MISWYRLHANQDLECSAPPSQPLPAAGRRIPWRQLPLTNPKFRITTSSYRAYQARLLVSCPLLTPGAPEELFRAGMVFDEGKQPELPMVTNQSHLELQQLLKGFQNLLRDIGGRKSTGLRSFPPKQGPLQNKSRLVRETASGPAHQDYHRWPRSSVSWGKVLERTKLFSVGRKKERWAEAEKFRAFQANGPTLQGQKTSFLSFQVDFIHTYIYIYNVDVNTHKNAGRHKTVLDKALGLP